MKTQNLLILFILIKLSEQVCILKSCKNLPPSCNAPHYNLLIKENMSIAPGSYIKFESQSIQSNASLCCEICAKDKYCTHFNYNCVNQQCIFYLPMNGMINGSDALRIIPKILTPSQGFVSGVLNPPPNSLSTRWI